MGRAPDRWAWAALAWAVAIGVAWLLVPAGTSTSTSTAVSSDGTVVTETSHPTLLASEGAGVLVPLAVPVVVAGAAVAAGRSRRARGVRLAAGGLLLAGCLVALLSVGLFYVPAGVALVVAGSLTATAV